MLLRIYYRFSNKMPLRLDTRKRLLFSAIKFCVNHIQYDFRYWLFKGRTDDVVKLYDLSSLCTTGEFVADTQQTQGKCRTNISGKDDKNPFTVPVAMLLYKVARNMKNSTKKIGAKQAGSIKELLVNCVKLLPEETHPQIVTSSYFLLADLHIPTGIDPISPEELIDSGSSYDDVTNNSDDSISTSVEDEHLPPPLTESIDERCLFKAIKPQEIYFFLYFSHIVFSLILNL